MISFDVSLYEVVQPAAWIDVGVMSMGGRFIFSQSMLDEEVLVMVTMICRFVMLGWIDCGWMETWQCEVACVVGAKTNEKYKTIILMKTFIVVV